MKPIQELSTTDLIDELSNRCQGGMMFLGLKPDTFSPNCYWAELVGSRISLDGIHKELGRMIEKRFAHLTQEE